MRMKRILPCLLSFLLLLSAPAASAADQSAFPPSVLEEAGDLSSAPETALPPEDILESSPESALPEEGAEEQLPNSEEPKTAGSICDAVGDLLETQAHNAYVSGYTGGTFRPSGEISRAEAAQLFYGLLRTQPQLTSSFSDVQEISWYGPAVLSLASLGAITGYSDGTFRPDAKITRAEFVTIAAKFSKLKSGAVDFADVGENHWARSSIASACAYGWIKGYPEGTFRPGGAITRTESVIVLNAMLQRTPDAYVENIYYTVEFSDVARSHWAYAQICEAATAHEYEVRGNSESWTLPDRYDGTGWVLSQGLIRYQDTETGEFLYGFEPVKNYTYYFDPLSGELQTGWKVIDGRHYLLPGMDQAESALSVQELLTEVNYTASNRSFGDIEYITMHYTAVPNDTAKGQCQYFQTQYRGASAGYFVDGNGIWRCVADRDVSWHCGNDVYYHDSCRNYNSIGIEMCSRKVNSANASSPYDPDWYFQEETMENSAALVRELMMKYGVPLENVIRHNDVSHKTCPAPFVNDFSAWQGFLDRVSEQQTDYDGTYPAEVTAAKLNVRSGPGQTHEILSELSKGDLVTVLEEKGTDADKEGRWARIEAGWVSYPYLCRLGE